MNRLLHLQLKGAVSSLAGVFLLACFAFSANGAWPEKPISIFVGWSAGGSSDITTRALAKEMEDILGERILVNNVNGAHGSIAARQVVRAEPDGHFWFGGAAVQGGWPVMGYGSIDWTDFYGFLTVTMPTTIYVRADAPWTTVQDLLKDIRTKPKGEFKFGHPGVGSNGHIFGGLVLEAGGVPGKAVAIPYNGGREAGRFLLAGQIQFASVTMGDLTDYAKAKRVRPLANLYSEDMDFEGVAYPSVTKAFPDLEPYQAINPYYGIYLRRETPESVITKIAEAFEETIRKPGFRRLAVQERAGILLPKVGRAADEQMSKIASARGWAMQDLGIARNNPAELGIPKLKEWEWPPNEDAAQLRPWPRAIQGIGVGSE